MYSLTLFSDGGLKCSALSWLSGGTRRVSLNPAKAIQLALLLVATGVLMVHGQDRQVSVTYTFDKPQTQVQGNQYTRLSVKGCAALQMIGQPEVPYRTGRILLPPAATVKQVDAELLAASQTIDVSKPLTFGRTPVPIGEQSHPSVARAARDAPDQKIYGADVPYPSFRVQLVSVQKMKGYSVAIVRVFPIQYRPAGGKLLFCPQIRVTLTLEAAPVQLNAVPMLRASENQVTAVKAFVDNPESVKLYDACVAKSVSPLAVFDYLLVTKAALTNAFQPLVAQKIADGLSVKVATVESIGANYSGVDDAEKVRTFITYAYTNWNTQYVLLGGDISTVPYRKAYAYCGGADTNMPCDLYFACLDGTWNSDGDGYWGEPTDGAGGGDVDLLAEVYVGRAPVDTASEVSNFVAKTVFYEQNGHANSGNARFLAEYLGNYSGINAHGGDGLDTLLPSFSGYDISWLDDRPSNSETWSTVECVDKLNESPHLVAHFGHANEIYALRMYESDIAGLSNTEPFLLDSAGCYCGAFDYSDCFAEQMLKSSECGAFAVIMNSRYGWFNASEEWMFTGEFMACFFNELLVQGNRSVGVANQLSKHDMIGSVETSGDMVYRWCYFETTLFGDPHAPLAENDLLGVTPATGLDASGPVGGPFEPSSVVYTVTNASDSAVTWAACVDAGWVTLSNSGGTLPAGGADTVAVSLAAGATSFPLGHYSSTVTFSNCVTHAVRHRPVELQAGRIDYFTELFDGSSTTNDLAWQSFTFQPDGSPSYYKVMRDFAEAFPVDPTGGVFLSLGDDGYSECALADGAQVALYGTAYSSFYVGANGYITFGSGTSTYSPSLSAHFSLPRISALFYDLYPESATVSWKQLADRAVITYANVPDLGEGLLNNIQVELFFNGSIRITYLDVGISGGLVGLSAGNGLPDYFEASDFSAYPLDDFMAVFPSSAFSSFGYAGGPFSPAECVYEVGNTGTNTLLWAVSKTAAWLSLSSSEGALATGAVELVAVTLNANANSLAPGTYQDSVVFSNRLSGKTRSRPVRLTTQGDLSFSAGTYSITEAGGVQKTIAVLRRAHTNLTATVDFSASPGTATAGADFVTTNGTLSFAAGETRKTFTVEVLDDASMEPDETVLLTLSNPTGGGTVGEPAAADLTILDDDSTRPEVTAAYVRSETGSPWGTTSNETAMDRVFGEGTWQDLRYESVVPDVLFSPAREFVFLEGSDSSADELEAFLTSNIGAIQEWVSLGGQLFINAAPNEGDGMDMGFGVSLTYPDTTDIGAAVNAAHPIFSGPFTPVGTQWSGGYFSHATVSGTGLSVLITNTVNGRSVLAEKAYGRGHVLFGSMTTADFHSPQPQAANLRANILAYTSTSAVGDDLKVSLGNRLSASGYEGGPFTPWYKVYMLTNAGSGSVAWTAGSGQNWVTTQPAAGTLAAGATVTVTVSIDSDANALSPGQYSDMLVISNTVSGFAYYHPVELTVLAVPGEIVVTDSITPATDLNMPFGPVVVGLSRTEQVTISNTDPTYDLVLSNIGIGMAGGGGGEYLAERLDSRVTQSAAGAVCNALAGTARVPVAIRWSSPRPTSEQSILIYADDPVHMSPDTFVDQALQALGLNYTAFYDGDLSGFTSALENDGPWDLVIFAGDNWYDSVAMDALHTYVTGGGRLIAHSWRVSSGHELWAVLGVDPGSVVDNGDPNTVYWWEDSPIFTDVPGFTDLDSGIFGVYGQSVEPLEGAEALAGYTETPETGQAALIVANEGRTVFRGFLDGQNSADLDSDGHPDGAELWQNLVQAVLYGNNFQLANIPELPYVLAPGSNLTFSVTYAPNAVKSEAATLVIESADIDEPEVHVALSGEGVPDYLSLSPESGLSGSGHPGGPFTPSSQVYSVSNNSAIEISWAIAANPSWVSVTPSSGTLASGAAASVTVTFNAAAAALLQGWYSGEVIFSNLTTTISYSRVVELEVFTTPVVRVAPSGITVTNLLGHQREMRLQIGNAAWADALLNFSLGASETSRNVVPATLRAAQRDFTQLPEGAEYRAGELLVRFAEGVSGTARLKALAAAGGGSVARTFKLVPGLAVVKLPEGMAMADALVRFNSTASILYAQPNYLHRADRTPNDTYFSACLWGMDNTGQTGGTADVDIDAPEAWEIGVGGQSVIVAVIDTGVDYGHEDLAENMWRNPGEIPGNGIDDDGNGYVDDLHGYDFCNGDADPMDDNGHGTHCAGTIGAVGDNGLGVAGVCWNVRIMAMKFLDSSGNGYTDAAISCMEYAVLMGARVLNNSWGGAPYEQAMKDAIDAAGAANVPFVAAAGNGYGNNNDTSPHFPSSYESDNVIAVMSVDATGAMSGFSNYGPQSVDLAAPGTDILSCWRGAYVYMNGTSMAAPHVSGACALLLSLNSAFNSQQVKSALMATTDSSLPGMCVSGGLMNLADAVTYTPAWLRLSPAAGENVAPGAWSNIAVTADAGTMAAGTYVGLISVRCNDRDMPVTNVPVTMVVLADSLSVSPAEGWPADGFTGGPFSPGSKVYTLTNAGGASLSWTAGGMATPWVSVSPASGVLAAGQSVQVTAAFNSQTEALSWGDYAGRLVFSNATSSAFQSRGVALSVYERVFDHFDWAWIAPTQYIGEAFDVTVTARDSGGGLFTNYSGVVSLEGRWGCGNVDTNILGGAAPYGVGNVGAVSYTLGYAFTPTNDLTVTHVRHYFGSKVSIWTDEGALVASQLVNSVTGVWTETPLVAPVRLDAGVTYRVGVNFMSNYYYHVSLPFSFRDGVINESYQGFGDAFPTYSDPTRWWFVDLRYTQGTGGLVAITPAESGEFANGVWQGQVTVLEGATNVQLCANDGDGHTGLSTLFDVVQPVIEIAEAVDNEALSWVSGGTADWFGEKAVTHDGQDAARSGVIGHRQKSWMSTQVAGACKVSFWWRVSSEAEWDWLEFYVDDVLVDRISGESGWLQKVVTLDEGSHTLKWSYIKDATDLDPVGQDCGWVDQVAVNDSSISLAEALDNEALTWSTGGTSLWEGQSSEAHDSVDAARSGTVSHRQSTWMSTQVTGSGSVSFWWRVSSEEGWDWLEFYVDDVLKERISGETGWSQKTVSLSDGSHTLKWRYVKDGADIDPVGQDCGWVDQFSGPSQSVLPLAWLQQYGLPTDGSADYLDSDGDGMNNWEEWFAATIPTNRLSLLKLEAISPDSGTAGFRVRWQSVAGKRYWLESCDMQTFPIFFTPFVSNVLGQALSTEVLDARPAADGKRLYRVGVQGD